jgi:hypothetical protein
MTHCVTAEGEALCRTTAEALPPTDEIIKILLMPERASEHPRGGPRFWEDCPVLVTGGSGFLGSRIVARLRSMGAEVAAPRSREYNLTRGEEVGKLFAALRPRVVIHGAAVVGGIGANRAHPGRVF